MGPSHAEAPAHEVHPGVVALRLLCTLIMIFVAGAGFLLGQLFAGRFDPVATLTAVGALAAAVLGWIPYRPSLRVAFVIATLMSLAGAGLHVRDYYGSYQLPGNYYPWFLTGPFVISLLLFLGLSLRSSARSGRGRLTQEVRL